MSTLKLPPTGPVAPASLGVRARFGSAIDLVGYDSTPGGDSLRITLDWRDRTPVDEADTVFVHVIDATGKVVAQHDGPPRQGSYPTTAWEADETIRDEHVVPLAGVPPGTYRVVVGLYRPTTGERLVAADASGEPVVDNGVQLFEVTVR
jgi:hypothetical protein